MKAFWKSTKKPPPNQTTHKMLIEFWKLKGPSLESFVLACWTKGFFFVCSLVFLCFEISLCFWKLKILITMCHLNKARDCWNNFCVIWWGFSQIFFFIAVCKGSLFNHSRCSLCDSPSNTLWPDSKISLVKSIKDQLTLSLQVKWNLSPRWLH